MSTHTAGSSMECDFERRESSSSSSHGTTRSSDESISSSATSYSGSTTPPAGVCLGDCNSIPTEVFLGAAAYLSRKDLNYATQVCRSWRHALHSNANLWRDLVIDLDKSYSLAKSKSYCQRSSNCLRSIRLFIGGTLDPQDMSRFLEERVKRMKQAFIQLDGGANIETFTLQSALTDVWGVWSLNLILQHLFSLEQSSPYLRNLQQAIFILAFPWLNIHNHILHHFNHAPQLELICTGLNEQHGNRRLQQHVASSDDFLKYLAGPSRGPSRKESKCISLTISAAYIDELTSIPSLPELQHLVLKQVHIGPIFYRLLANSPQLQILHLENVIFPHLIDQRKYARQGGNQIDEDLEDALLQGHSLDLTLPNLRKLLVVGKDTAPFWQHERKLLKHIPDVIMPNLDKVELLGMMALDEVVTPKDPLSKSRIAALEAWHEDVEWSEEDEELFDLRFDSLWTLCSTSKMILSLNLTNSAVNDNNLAEALRCTPNLQCLSLCGITDVTDWGFELLIGLIPALRFLDTRSTWISPRSVAKMFEDIRECGGRLEEVVMDDPGPFYETEAQLWDDIAYKWLDWIGVLVDWVERSRKRNDSKRVWQPIQLQVQQQRR